LRISGACARIDGRILTLKECTKSKWRTRRVILAERECVDVLAFLNCMLEKNASAAAVLCGPGSSSVESVANRIAAPSAVMGFALGILLASAL